MPKFITIYFNDEELKLLRAYARRKDIAPYSAIKKAIMKAIERELAKSPEGSRGGLEREVSEPRVISWRDIFYAQRHGEKVKFTKRGRE